MQYRTADDEKVRAEHASLHGVTLPMDDPFWDEYYPPLGWNCRCTVVQVLRNRHTESDSNTAIDNGRIATEKTPSFRFNPGKKMKCFPDNVSYLKHAGQNRRERDMVEMKCERLNQNETIVSAKKNLLNTTAECTIKGEKHEVEFIRRGIEHYAGDIIGKKNIFWIKNEILTKIQEYIKNAECIGKKKSDTEHNTRKETVQLKEQTDYFYYFKISLPNGKEVYLHLGRYNAKKEGKEGKMYLYSITNNPPQNMETP